MAIMPQVSPLLLYCIVLDLTLAQVHLTVFSQYQRDDVSAAYSVSVIHLFRRTRFTLLHPLKRMNCAGYSLRPFWWC